MYAQERPALQPLPEKPFAYFRIGSRKVSPLDSHVQVKGAYYPVPPRYMGQQVDVHFNSEWVKVLHQGKVIQWLSTTEKGRFHSDRSCLPRNKAIDRNAWQQSLLQRCDRTGGDVRRWADQAISARGLLAYRSIQGVLSLLKKYPARDLNKACRLARERSSFSYHLIRNYLEEGILKQEDQQSGLRLQQSGDMIRTPQSYARLFEEVSS